MEATQLLHHPGLEFWQVFHIKPQCNGTLLLVKSMAEGSMVNVN